MGGQAYFLALARTGITRSETRIVGLNKSGSGCPPPDLFCPVASRSNPSQALTLEEQNEIFQKFKDHIEDLKYYAKHHKFRRLDHWLSATDS